MLVRRTIAALLSLAVAVVAPVAAQGAESSLYGSTYNTGQVSQFDIGPGGLLSPKSPAAVPAAAANLAEGIAISPDGQSLYLSDLSSKVRQFSIGAGGLLTPKAPPFVSLPGSSGGRIAISPDGGSLYAPTDTKITQLDIGAGGLLSLKSPATVSAPASVLSAAVSPDGHSVYAVGVSVVAQYDVGAGGVLTPKTPPTVPGGGIWVSVRPDGRSVYIGALSAGVGVLQYGADANGALTPLSPPSVAVGLEAAQLAISPSGTSLYAAAFNSNGVAQFDIGADGGLSQKSTFVVPGGTKPAGMAVAPNGRSAYLGNYGSVTGGGTTISQYTAGADGSLTAATPPTVASPTGPWWMFARPDQGPVASFTVRRAAAGSPVSFDGTATHDVDDTVSRFDWDFGDGSKAANAPATITHVFAPGTHQVTLTATDDAGCSNRLIFTGQVALCNGTGAATKTVSVVVPHAFGGVVLRKQTVKAKGRKALVKLTCPAGIEGPCAGSLTLKAPRGGSAQKSAKRLRTVGTGKFSIAAGLTRKVKVKITKAAAKRVRVRGLLMTTAIATAHDGFGTQKTTGAKVKLKRAKPRHAKR